MQNCFMLDYCRSLFVHYYNPFYPFNNLGVIRVMEGASAMQPPLGGLIGVGSETTGYCIGKCVDSDIMTCILVYMGIKSIRPSVISNVQ